jgi:hypothetical protein
VVERRRRVAAVAAVSALDRQKNRVAWMAACCCVFVTAYTGAPSAGLAVLFGLLALAMMVLP